MRTLLIAANWKMNGIPEGALKSDSPYRTHANCDVVVFPTFLDLKACIDTALITGAQTSHPKYQGAHTGDISINMLKDIGCHYVLCGHSERRSAHGETNDDVAAQAISALEKDIHPIMCVGETWEERKAGKEKDVIKEQLSSLPLESDVTLAYEPVWAISGGDPSKPAATKKDAQDMHAYIRSLLPDDRKGSTRILYGGSMKPENAKELLSQPDIDGGLIGGASLDSETFKTIVNVAKKLPAE